MIIIIQIIGERDLFYDEQIIGHEMENIIDYDDEGMMMKLIVID